jgi:hypothetical protein
MRRPALWILMVALIALLPMATSEPAAASHVPASRITRSYYVGSSSSDKAVLLGCRQGDKNGRMTLFFGAPTAVGSSYGATLWGAPNLTTAQIRNLAMDFIRGYAFCRQSASFRLLIGLGTSNSTIDGRSTTWLRAHGRAWAGMVDQVATWASRFYPMTQVYGADVLYPTRRALYANFSADGCPTATATNGACNNGWNQSAVWHLAWDHNPSLTIPQIYATSGVNARQWQLIDEWATHNRGDGIHFYGVLSQSGACAQVGGCSGTNNSPHRAWEFMIWWLRSHAHTWQASIDTITDVNWHS